MGLHASPTRWYEKTVPLLRTGARRHLRSAVAVTAVVAASAGAWIVVDNGDDAPVTAAAGLGTAGRTVTAAPVADVPAGTVTPWTPFAQAGSSGTASAASERHSTSSGAGTAEAAKAAATQKEAAEPPKAAKPVKPAKPAKKPTAKAKVISSGSCGASFYDEGQMTASGERFNPDAMTAAHKTLPMGSKVRVTNPRNGRTVTVRINDRGPFVSGRCLDLSRAAFDTIGSLSTGAMTVKYAVLAR
ncbi:septal ring lytic transglycosylase RlpA family protein [Sphaerisporangium sp. NPDC088356]|uniref:septal ring lytic transglycosylase RlpA family protein n=1 Tax=Sphaerisporangium sp. NPDC088356 TaxID=3154871 RepID=UPI0034360811